MSQKHISDDSRITNLVEHYENRNKLVDRYVEAWDKKKPDFGMAKLYNYDKAKARNTAIALTNQERYIERNPQFLRESIISTAFQFKPENVLKAVRIGVANSNRGRFATEYQLTSVNDAFYYIQSVYEQTLRGATAGQKAYEVVAPFYSGETVPATIDGAGAATSYTVTVSTPKPIVPFTVRVYVGGAVIGNDNGANQLTFTGMNTGLTNTVNYTTGQFIMNFLVAPNLPVTVQYNWNSEDATLFSQYGTMSIDISKHVFNARPMPLSYSISNMTELLLSTTGLGSGDDILMQFIGDQHAQAKDYRAVNVLKGIALTNGTDTFDTDNANFGEDNYQAHAQRLLTKIKAIGGLIYDDIKRGQINKIIAGSQAAAYITYHNKWVADDSQPKQGVYYAGKLEDIEVFVCPADPTLINNNQMILIYKNEQEGLDTAVVFGVLTELTASLQYPQFYKQGSIATVEDRITFNTKFVRLLELTNLV
jgi:hypothetical protein